MEKKYLIDNPKLMAEWNFEKNIDLDPSKITLGSGKKVWWKCKKGHEWEASTSSRNKGSGCPYCFGRNAIKGENDLQTVNNILAKEWNYEKNNDLTPADVLPNSNKKVWWKCSFGHEWESSIDNRNKGSGCPYCAGKKVLVGYNDLQTINPRVADEWNYEKNAELTPVNVTPNSNKKVWWKCSVGHEWETSINHRNNGRNCPYCAGKKVIKGYTDLQTTNPVLASEWNYEKNNGLTPKEVSSGSDRKVWWICENMHEWQATISSRAQGADCPYCANQKAIKGFNDLQTINPTLAREWNYEKNNELTPLDIMPNSNKKVWWICKKGHEWQATVSHRNNGRGCPICSSERKTSFPEYALVFYLKKYGIDVIHSYKKQGYELDVYIPSMKTAIEYDGFFWHENKAKQDLEKNSKCKKDGIKLYRIREKLPALKDSSIDFIINDYYKDLQTVLEKVLSELINKNLDINLERDNIEIENLREYTEKENSLLIMNPKIAQEWNYAKNGKLRPEIVSASSHKKAWWICSKGHEWQAAISSRNKGAGCPYCFGRIAIKGENDLQTLNPTLASEWNYEKNNALTPIDVKPNSNKKVWWKCAKGHEYQAAIYNRSTGGGCPYCANQLLLMGYNDLQTVNPTLANEWNYEKNNGLTPMDVFPNSKKRVWWKCKNGHEWQTSPQDRNRGTGCPYCSGRRLIKGKNDLQTINPILASEWNYEKNAELTPAHVFPNSNKKVWWKCKNGHEWEAAISNRNKGRGCPYCSGRKKPDSN